MEAARESNAAPDAEEALDFDDVTLKGEKKGCKCLARICKQIVLSVLSVRNSPTAIKRINIPFYYLLAALVVIFRKFATSIIKGNTDLL